MEKKSNGNLGGKYPAQIYSTGRPNVVLSLEFHLGLPPEDQPALTMHAGWSRYVTAIVDKRKGEPFVVSANIPVADASLIGHKVKAFFDHKFFVSDYLSYILATIGKSFYGETSFISLDEFIDAGEVVCVNENCNTSITLDFSDEGYKGKVTHHARNFYYENVLYGVEVELYGKSTAEGSFGDFIIENSTEKVAEKRVYKNDEESTFLGEIKIESVIVPYSEMISGSDSLYETSIIISFNGIEMYSDETIKELDGYILKKVLFTYEDNNIVIEDEGEENYCMVTESEVTYDEFMTMVENYENELGIKIN